MQQTIAHGRKHLEFRARLYEIQWRDGCYLLHEHLDAASSWQDECATNILKRRGVVRVVGDQCRYGLRPHDGQREGFARKMFGFVTDSQCIAKSLSLKCPNANGKRVRDHVALINERAKAAHVYPPAPCRAACKELIEEMEGDRMGQFLIAGTNANLTGDSGQWKRESQEMQTKRKIVEEDDDVEAEVAWDDVSGAELDPTVAQKAGAEEIDLVRNM